MGLHKESILVQGEFVHLGQIRVVPGQNSTGKNKEIGIEYDITAKDMVLDGDLDIFTLFGDQGFAFQFIADKDDAQAPRFPVEFFPLPVGANIPVEDKDIHVGIGLFEMDCGMDGVGTTNL